MNLAQEHRRLRSLLSQLSAVEAAAETGVAALEPVFTAVPRFKHGSARATVPTCAAGDMILW